MKLLINQSIKVMKKTVSNFKRGNVSDFKKGDSVLVIKRPDPYGKSSGGFKEGTKAVVKSSPASDIHPDMVIISSAGDDMYHFPDELEKMVTVKPAKKVAQKTVPVKGSLIQAAIEDGNSTQVGFLRKSCAEYFADYAKFETELEKCNISDPFGEVEKLLSNKVYNIPEKTIKEGAAMACESWKTELEKQFPEVFAVDKNVYIFNASHGAFMYHADKMIPLQVSKGIRPTGYAPGESLFVEVGYEVEVIKEDGRQFLIFKKTK